MRLAGWLSILQAIPHPHVCRKSGRRSQGGWSADAVKQWIALEKIFPLQGLLTGAYLVGAPIP
jgi:hypothetical protein